MGFRSRAAPCFCGSGRAFKHCCLRSLKQVDTIRQTTPMDSASGCRWRIWRCYGPGAGRLASREVAEHRCGGEFVWVARAREQLGVSWMIEDRPYTLIEVLEDVPSGMAGWVIDQTLEVLAPAFTALGEIVREHALEPEVRPDPQRMAELEGDERFAALAELTQEFLVFAHAAGELGERMERLRLRIVDEGGRGGGGSTIRPAA